MNSAPGSCFLRPAAAATTALAAAAGASGREAEAEAGVEATPPAMEEDEARVRPENQEDVEAGEVMIAAVVARPHGEVIAGCWRLVLRGLDRAVTRGRRRCDLALIN